MLESVWNLLQNLWNNIHLTVGRLLHYLGKLKSQFCVDIQQTWNKNANKVHFYVHRFCCCVSVFGSVNCACVPQLFQQLINTMLCPAFLRKICLSTSLLCRLPLQIQTFYQNLVLIAEYHVDCNKHCSESAVTNYWSHKLIAKVNK